MKSKPSPPQHAFDYLVERLLDRCCTPFIGAGISSEATKGGKPWAGQKGKEMVRKAMSHTIPQRLQRLVADGKNLCHKCNEVLHPYLSDCADKIFPLPDKEGCGLCDFRRIHEGTKLADACEAFVWEFGKLTDENHAYKELVKLLEIAEFPNLDPTPAHFYLAYLSREGLLNEFITTNYDCNLESAYIGTFGKEERINPPVDVISNLEEYTSLAGKRADHHPGQDTPHRIKVYKINGCAGKLGIDINEALNILLTEAQLQNWRNRRWAGDMFRVKFRSTCVTLIAFGNEEPQIRHTVQQVLEEYSHFGATKTPSEGLFNNPNVPIVTMFGAYPSFPQSQLIHGYAQWMGFAGSEGEKLLLGPQQFREQFPDFNHGNLPADKLWESLYQAVFRQLVFRALNHAAAKENAAFTATVPGAARLLRHIAEEWLQKTASAVIDHFLAKNWRDFGVLYRPRLIWLLNLLHHGDNDDCRYTSINDHQSLTAELVALYWLLYKISDSSGEKISVSWRRPLICFDLNLSDRHQRLFISHRHHRNHWQQPEMTPSRSTVALELCLGADGVHAKAETYRLLLEENVCNKTPLDVVRLAWRHLFPADLPLNSVKEELPRRLADAMQRPGKYLRRAEPSVRRRPYLEEMPHE